MASDVVAAETTIRTGLVISLTNLNLFSNLSDCSKSRSSDAYVTHATFRSSLEGSTIDNTHRRSRYLIVYGSHLSVQAPYGKKSTANLSTKDISDHHPELLPLTSQPVLRRLLSTSAGGRLQTLLAILKREHLDVLFHPCQAKQQRAGLRNIASGGHFVTKTREFL